MCKMHAVLILLAFFLAFNVVVYVCQGFYIEEFIRVPDVKVIALCRRLLFTYKVTTPLRTHILIGLSYLPEGHFGSPLR